MNNSTRTYNVKRNLLYGVISQFLITVLTFVSRTIFIKMLGAEYLGINGLYSNILTFLSLTELGLGNIALYSLYKPVSDNDYEKINRLLSTYRKIYNTIAVIFFVVGLALIPFLRFVINSPLSHFELIIYYILFLFNSVCSYISIVYQFLINADQKLYIIKKCNTEFRVFKVILQIIFLFIIKSYYIYLILECVITLLQNLYLSAKTKKMYSFINTKLKVCKEEFKIILKNVKNIFVYKVSNFIIDSTDNIFISIILGTALVGYYSNYTLVVNSVVYFINIISSSVLASIGNLNAKDDLNKKIDIFYKLLFVIQWIISLCSICLFLLFNDFICIWIGKEFIFDSYTVLIIVGNFYLTNIISPIWIYRETLGLFKEVKNIMLLTSILNAFLSSFLGIKYGLFGILLATIISKILTIVWFEPVVLLKKKLNTSVTRYYLQQIRNLFICVCACLFISYFVSGIIVNDIFGLIFKFIIIVLMFNLIYIIIFFRSDNFRYLVKKIFN